MQNSFENSFLNMYFMVLTDPCHIRYILISVTFSRCRVLFYNVGIVVFQIRTQFKYRVSKVFRNFVCKKIRYKICCTLAKLQKFFFLVRFTKRV